LAKRSLVTGATQHISGTPKGTSWASGKSERELEELTRLFGQSQTHIRRTIRCHCQNLASTSRRNHPKEEERIRRVHNELNLQTHQETKTIRGTDLQALDSFMTWSGGPHAWFSDCARNYTVSAQILKHCAKENIALLKHI
jgi:hypothetical protein